MNSRLDEMQAAILRARLPLLDSDNTRRVNIARQYQDSLGDLSLRLPAPWPNETPVYHQFTIRLPKRDELRAFLAEKKIQTALFYPQPIHQQPAYRDRIATAGDLSVTEHAARELLCLPIHPWMIDAEVAKVAAAIREFHD